MASHITINGHTYSSVDEMPSDVRRQYEAAMQLLSRNSGVLADHAPGNISISTTGSDPARRTFKVVTRNDREPASGQRQRIRRLGKRSRKPGLLSNPPESIP